MAESTINTCFCRKPRCLDDLLEERRRGPVRVQVEQIIQLTYEQYQHFLSHIWEDMPFFEAHKRSTDCDSKGVSRCLLVTARNIWGGVLVDCPEYPGRCPGGLPGLQLRPLRSGFTGQIDSGSA